MVVNERASSIEEKDNGFDFNTFLYPIAFVLFCLSLFEITGSVAILGVLIAIISGVLGTPVSNDFIVILNLGINFSAQLGGIAAFYFLFLRKKVELDEKKKLPGNYLVIVILVHTIIFGLMLEVLNILDGYLDFLGETESTYSGISGSVDLLSNPLYFILFFGVLVIGAPLFEELVFRRGLIPFLERRGLGEFYVLIISGLMFSLIHTPADLISGSYRFAVIHFVSTFSSGIALGYIYVRTRDIRWPIFLHALQNGISGIITYFNPLIDLNNIEATNFNILMLISVLGLWVLISIVLAIAVLAWLLGRFFKNRNLERKQRDIWNQILTDMSHKKDVIRPFLLSVGLFILIEVVIPVFIEILIFPFFGADPSREAGIMMEGIKLLYSIIIFVVCFVFIFKKANPVQNPSYSSTIEYQDLLQINPYFQQYSQPESQTNQPQISFATFGSCGVCGKEIIKGSKFCVYCGAQYQRQEEVIKATFCPSCGKEIIKGHSFCVYCGEKIEETI